MFAHPAGDVRRDNMAIFQLHPEHCVGQCIDDSAFHFDMIFFGHNFSLAVIASHLKKDWQP